MEKKWKEPVFFNQKNENKHPFRTNTYSSEDLLAKQIIKTPNLAETIKYEMF